MFLMPGMLIALYTTGKLESVLSAQHRHEMVRYLVNHQNSDGGYGLHIEGSSTMFGTVLRCGGAYCSKSQGLGATMIRLSLGSQMLNALHELTLCHIVQDAFTVWWVLFCGWPGIMFRVKERTVH